MDLVSQVPRPRGRGRPLFADLPLAITACGGLEGCFSLAITALGAFDYIVPKYLEAAKRTK